MFIFVVFSIFLFRGSTESKSLEDDEEVNEKPDQRRSPHPMIRKGGILLWIYANTLSIALFLFSFIVHSWRSYKYHEKQGLLKHQLPEPF